MDCLQTLRAGTVVKVDGGYAAVHFPALEPEEIEEASLDNCRLLRKDDLIVGFSNGTFSAVPPNSSQV